MILLYFHDKSFEVLKKRCSMVRDGIEMTLLEVINSTPRSRGL